MKTLSLVTQKGGSGKSTLARHLAVAAHIAGLRVAVLDTDMQGSLRDWSETRAAPDGPARPEPAVSVELSPNQRHIEGRLASLREAGHDLVVIDTPGGLQTPVPFIAAGLSDLALVPMRPTSDDLAAFWPLHPRLLATRVPTFAVLSACPTTSPRPRVDMMAALLAEGVAVCPVAIHEKGIVPASHAAGLTVHEMEPETEAERRTLREFQSLAAWVGDQIGLEMMR